MSQYANLDDVNTHLPSDKLEMDTSELPLYALDAERIIRGYVGGVIPYATYNAWADPDSTPELIRAIAGRLIAAAYYASKVAENDPDVPAFAQQKYNEAVALLMGIRLGTQEVIEVDGQTIDINAISLSSADFNPNNSSSPPAFTRDMIFG